VVVTVSLAKIRSAFAALTIEPDLDGVSPAYASSIKIGCQLVKDAVLQDLADYMMTAGATGTIGQPLRSSLPASPFRNS
jgi:hypothetical protein